VFPVPPLAPADVGDDGDDNDDGDDDAERTKQRQVDESIHASLTYPFRSTVAKVGTDLRGVGISEGGPHLQTSSAVKTEVFAESHVQARNFHVDQFIWLDVFGSGCGGGGALILEHASTPGDDSSKVHVKTPMSSKEETEEEEVDEREEEG